MLKNLFIAFITFFVVAASANAVSYGVYDLTELRYEHSRNTSEVRSIASITKLFTAKAVIDSGVDLDEKVKVQGRSGGRFARGAMVERYELLRATLMSSDNLAAESLAHAHPGGFKQFIKDVNEDISQMDLKNTVIVDATGLLAGNQSTVEDLKEFLFSLRRYEIIKSLSTEKYYAYKYKRGKRTITIHLKNTNPQMWTYDEIVLTKTGYTSKAGRCLAMLVEKNGILYAVITLGNRDVRSRSATIDELMNEHIYVNSSSIRIDMTEPTGTKDSDE
jgi:D-alanyl-D-alanine endopeptidase (penicillin-binding protein 7)